jgi:hypothetical protein
MTSNTPVNVDCMSMCDLEAVVSNLEIDYHVREYADKVMTAKSYRLAGMISLAIEWEYEAERVFSLIPVSLRW